MGSIRIAILLFGFSISLQAQNDEAVFSYVERMPQFPDGTEAMYQYIYTNLQYPAEALKNKISGLVVVQFVVDSVGELRKTKVVRKLGYGCDEEAIRIIESMNDGHKWIPGEHNGRSVPVTFTLPIKFVLPKNN